MVFPTGGAFGSSQASIGREPWPCQIASFQLRYVHTYHTHYISSQLHSPPVAPTFSRDQKKLPSHLNHHRACIPLSLCSWSCAIVFRSPTLPCLCPPCPLCLYLLHALLECHPDNLVFWTLVALPPLFIHHKALKTPTHSRTAAAAYQG